MPHDINGVARFYWAVNIGALSPLITVNVEAKVSFWLAFLIPLVLVNINTRPHGFF